jgi:type II secretory pathway predicted ATPase ExeA
MFEQHFGLQRAPFGRDVPTAALLPSAAQTQAIAALGYAIAQRQIAVLVGEIGAGKSSVLRATLAALSPARFPQAYLPAAPRDARDLYRTLLGEFGEVAPWSTADARTRLRALLLGLADAGRTPVLVCDEAQDLAPALLEQLRLLTSFDLDSRPVFALLLVGQPELARLVRRKGSEALAQRVGSFIHLLGLSREETDRYLLLHLELAGTTRPLFSADASAVLFAASKGLPRTINRLATACLEAAFLHRLDAVDAALADATVSECA